MNSQRLTIIFAFIGGLFLLPINAVGSDHCCWPDNEACCTGTPVGCIACAYDCETEQQDDGPVTVCIFDVFIPKFPPVVAGPQDVPQIFSALPKDASEAVGYLQKTMKLKSSRIKTLILSDREKTQSPPESESTQ